MSFWVSVNSTYRHKMLPSSLVEPILQVVPTAIGKFSFTVDEYVCYSKARVIALSGLFDASSRI